MPSKKIRGSERGSGLPCKTENVKGLMTNFLSTSVSMGGRIMIDSGFGWILNPIRQLKISFS